MLGQVIIAAYEFENILAVHAFKNQYILALVSLFISLHSVKSQEGPITTFESGQADDRIASYQYFDINQFEQRTLLKAGMFVDGTFDRAYNSGWLLTLEKKVFPSLSVEFTGYTAFYARPAWGFKTRYYPSKRKQSQAKNDRVNNFTGNYISAGYMRNLPDSEEADYSLIRQSFFDNRNTFMLSFGRQQKVGKWGYFDTGFSVKYFTEFRSLQFGFDLNAGFGYGRSVPPSEHAEGADKHGSLRKASYSGRNTLSIENPNLWLGETYRAAGLTFSSEYKLMGYFSLVALLKLWHSQTVLNGSRPDLPDNDKVDRYSMVLSTELRRYVGVRKRLNRGKPVQMFTGSYVALKIEDLLFTANRAPISFTGLNQSVRQGTIISPIIGGIYGWQQRLGKLFFIDLNAGLAYHTNESAFRSIGRTRIGMFLRK